MSTTVATYIGTSVGANIDSYIGADLGSHPGSDLGLDNGEILLFEIFPSSIQYNNNMYLIPPINIPAPTEPLDYDPIAGYNPYRILPQDGLEAFPTFPNNNNYYNYINNNTNSPTGSSNKT